MTLNKTVEWFQQAVPAPDSKTLSVQLGCHIEEFCELLESFHTSGMTDQAIDIAFRALGIAAEELKTGESRITGIDKLPMLDAIADGIVTAAGLAYMQGMDIDGALAEVNRSNFSKFEDGQPVFLEGGKIGKGKGYTPPDLERFAGKGK